VRSFSISFFNTGAHELYRAQTRIEILDLHPASGIALFRPLSRALDFDVDFDSEAWEIVYRGAIAKVCQSRIRFLASMNRNFLGHAFRNAALLDECIRLLSRDEE
jgi:hypothetical protein